MKSLSNKTPRNLTDRDRVVLVATHPPPVGGIAVHIERLIGFLEDHEIGHLVYSHGNDIRITHAHGTVIGIGRSYGWWLRFLIRSMFSSPGRVIHFHYFHPFHFVFVLLYSHLVRNCRIIITIHNEDIVNRPPRIRRRYFACLKRTRYAKLITVSETLATMLNDAGIPALYLPAYIPPRDVKATPLPAAHPGKRRFVVNTWKLNGEMIDRYGLDLAIRLLGCVKDEYDMVLFVGSDKDYDASEFHRLLRGQGVEDCATILIGKPLVDYLHQFDFLLRPNRQDGYGVAVQEALTLGVNVIASDVCTRAKGTILFESGRFDALRETVMDFINRSEHDRRQQLQQSQRPEFHDVLIRLYKTLLADS